jgi:hypothetical protein
MHFPHRIYIEAGIPIFAPMAHAASLGGTTAMRRLVGTAILCMLATIPAYAQQNHDDQQQETSKAPERSGQHAEKPASKSPEKPVDKPSKPPKEAPVTTKSAPRHQQDQQQKQAQQQAKAEQKAQQNNQKAQEKQAKNQRHDQNANHGHAETADNAARGNKGEHRIPEDRYRADFGRAHTFHVRHDRNDRRFQFGGYWFEYTNAWPSDWNYDDNFYIVEIDGIDYLCDARFPDQRIVVVIEG